MMSHEIEKSDLDTISWAVKVVSLTLKSSKCDPYLLPEPLLTVWAVDQAQGVIDNGGFGYFYGNDWPKNPPYSVFWDAFKRIGAFEAAQCIETTAKLFPFERPELDFQKRRDYLNLSNDRSGSEKDDFDILASRFIDLCGESSQLLSKYIKDNESYFITAEQRPENKEKTTFFQELTQRFSLFISGRNKLFIALLKAGYKAHRFPKSSIAIALPQNFTAAFDSDGVLIGSLDGHSKNFSATLHSEEEFRSDPNLAYGFLDHLAEKAGVMPQDKGKSRYFKDPNLQGEDSFKFIFYVIAIPKAVVVISIASSPNFERPQILKRIEESIPDLVGEQI